MTVSIDERARITFELFYVSEGSCLVFYLLSSDIQILTKLRPSTYQQMIDRISLLLYVPVQSIALKIVFQYYLASNEELGAHSKFKKFRTVQVLISTACVRLIFLTSWEYNILHDLMNPSGLQRKLE